jgi:murein peptide amidase A
MIKLVKKTHTANNNLVELFFADFLSPQLKGKTILIIGVFHGDEPEGEFLTHKLMREIEQNPQLITNNTVLLIPCLNPDGKELKTRTNANGVDLNRNFPTKNWELSKEKDSYYSGHEPASETETGFLIEILEEYRPDRILTLHTPYRVVNYDGPAKEIAEKISKLNGYPVQKNIGYPTPGSFGTYAGIERNIPVITLELPDNEPLEKLWDENKEAFYYFIK